MKWTIFSMVFAGLLCLQGCTGSLAASKGQEPDPPHWKLEVQREGSDLAHLRVRISNLSSHDQPCHAVDAEGRFYGEINVKAAKGDYRLVPKEKYAARVLGADFYNDHPVGIKAGESKAFTISLKRDYVSSSAPSEKEGKWIREAIERRVITERDRDIQNDWWDEIKNDGSWIVSVSFLHPQLIPKPFPRSGSQLFVQECRSQDVKINRSVSQ